MVLQTMTYFSLKNISSRKYLLLFLLETCETAILRYAITSELHVG